jgi:DNA-binding transcriptional regulator LsrR (DeoR family)
VAGWVFDAEGQFLEQPDATRNGGVRIEPGLARPAIGVAAGPSKVPAMRAALAAGILNGIVTDESSARAILSGA